MTKTKTFSLEETTIERLKLEDNQSGTIEAALKLYWEHKDTAKLLISRNKEILAALTSSPSLTASNQIAGLPCCLNSRPCKHWVWDGALQAHINQLTGEVRTADF